MARREAARDTQKGYVKKIVRDKGFGFIRTPEGVEFFFHRSGVDGNGFDSMVEGNNVEFSVAESPKGPRAEAVRLL